MTITQMHDWFKILLDKWNTPYYTDSEIDMFINRAAANWINQNVFVRREQEEGLVIKSASEFSNNWEFLVYPIIKSDINVTTSANALSLATILAALPANTDIVALLSVLDPAGYDVKWWRHNNVGTESRNYFTRPSSTYRKYKVDNGALIVSPNSIGEVFKVSVIRTMVPVSKSGLVDCELPEAAHEKIVAMAVDLAKFPTEDESVGGISKVTV